MLHVFVTQNRAWLLFVSGPTAAHYSLSREIRLRPPSLHFPLCYLQVPSVTLYSKAVPTSFILPLSLALHAAEASISVQYLCRPLL